MTTQMPPRAMKFALLGFLLTLVAFAGMQSRAQVFGAHNSNAPVDFDAGRIELQDRQNRVVLSGNVIINQAGLRLTAPRTLVNYSDAGSLNIDRITATGGVTVTRAGESARGDVAIYDLDRRLITMAGNVRLQQRGNTLNGGRLVINLATGVSSVDGRASGSTSATGTGATTGGDGRVTGRFTVPDRGE
ncbi:MAG: LptA/OstA family protein [Alteripontixanthobacter sp.]